MKENGIQRNGRVWPWILIGLLVVGGLTLLIIDIPPVVLTWDTASEVGTAGFNVYRSPANEDAFERVNATLIAAQGDELTGAAYRFEDNDVRAGRRYIYRIEEVEWDGSTNVYPETVSVRAGLPTVWTKVEGGVLMVLGVILLWREVKR